MIFLFYLLSASYHCMYYIFCLMSAVAVQGGRLFVCVGVHRKFRWSLRWEISECGVSDTEYFWCCKCMAVEVYTCQETNTRELHSHFACICLEKLMYWDIYFATCVSIKYWFHNVFFTVNNTWHVIFVYKNRIQFSIHYQCL